MYGCDLAHQYSYTSFTEWTHAKCVDCDQCVSGKTWSHKEKVSVGQSRAFSNNRSVQCYEIQRTYSRLQFATCVSRLFSEISYDRHCSFTKLLVSRPQPQNTPPASPQSYNIAARSYTGSERPILILSQCSAIKVNISAPHVSQMNKATIAYQYDKKNCHSLY